MSFPTKDEVVQIYRKRARNYDITANLYYLLGYRERHYRRAAVEALRLKPGDTVLELGCGTGLNFPLLQKRVGREGRIIGVDLTDAMLEQARQRVADNGWGNVELRQADVSRYSFPTDLNGIISTFALSLVPELRRVIHKGGEALVPSGRLVILDLKVPSNWLGKLTPLVIPIERPFGVTAELAQARPWVTIQETMTESLVEVDHRDLFGGFSFLSSGTRAAASERSPTV